MAGGNFDINAPKARPGNYFNFKARKKQKSGSPSRGIAVVPLLGYDWGPDGEFIKLTSDAPDGAMEKLGRSIDSDDDGMILLRLAMEEAATVYAYVISGGAEASKTVEGLTISAMYAGTRGNDICVSSEANVQEGYNVSVYLEHELVEFYEAVSSVEDLTAVSGKYVKFSGQGELSAFAAARLEGGTNRESTNGEFVSFLDKVERVKCNAVLIPVSEESLAAAAASKVKYLRTKIGKTVQFVFANYAGDDIGIINVVNAFRMYEKDLSVIQAAAWVTGATAAAGKTDTNTYKAVGDAKKVIGELSNEEAVDAIKEGKFFFSADDEGQVIVETDINSLVNPSEDQDDSYKKNRVIRVFDSFADDLNALLPPAKFDNSPEGWKLMLGLGRSLLKKYSDADGGDGAIRNVDPDNDFTIDASRSTGDATYFNIALQPIDSSEKHYFSVSTQ